MCVRRIMTGRKIVLFVMVSMRGDRLHLREIKKIRRRQGVGGHMAGANRVGELCVIL